MPIPTSQKPPFIPAPGVAAIEMIYTFLGQKMENVYHVQSGSGSGPLTAAQLTTIAQRFIAWEHNTALPGRHTGCTLSLVRARDLTEQAGVVVEVTPTVAVTGTATGFPAPGNVTFAVKWSTGRGGRSYRGRTFHVGLNVGSFDGNALLTAMVAPFTVIYQALLTAANSAGSDQLVVLSKAHNKFWRDTAVATPVLAVSIDQFLDSQRRRLQGRGT